MREACLCLQDLAPLAPLETKVDDLLDLDEESLKTMLNPDSLEEVRNNCVLVSVHGLHDRLHPPFSVLSLWHVRCAARSFKIDNCCSLLSYNLPANTE